MDRPRSERRNRSMKRSSRGKDGMKNAQRTTKDNDATVALQSDSNEQL